MDHPIEFHSEDIEFSLSNPEQVADWIATIIEQHDFELAGLTYIFCSDDYLHQINVEYLDHDTLTDIITFDNSSEDKVITGDIFISIERIRENAAKFNQSVTDELHRVIIHGALHLLGYKDKTAIDSKNMTQMEDKYLDKRTFNK